jgi:hypothetical protein
MAKSAAGKKGGLFDCTLPKIARRSFRVVKETPTWKDELAALRRGDLSGTLRGQAKLGKKTSKVLQHQLFPQ